MDRCALFVDAGYLFAEGGKLCFGITARRELELDAGGLNDELVALANGRCGLPVLRTYWYDGARDGIATPSQQRIAGLANVKLRLGRLNARNEQKGVDALIFRDLMTLARERAITDAFLLSGDEDLREGVRAAQDMGVRVTLIGIATRNPAEFNQSRELSQEVDEVVQLSRDVLAAYFRRSASTTGPPLTLLTPSLAPSASPDREPAEVAGEQFASAWWSEATDAQRSALRAQQPRIPQALDVELLLYVEAALGFSLRGQDTLHRAARRGFWGEVERAATSELSAES